MANVAVVSSKEKTDHGDSLLFLRKIVNGLSLRKRGFAVLRDWKIYAEFSAPAYQRHNVARLQHLDSLGLDLARKSVLEVGAGVVITACFISTVTVVCLRSKVARTSRKGSRKGWTSR